MDSAILDLVERTPFIDTHEHLIEESQRLAGATDGALFPCDDWAVLFHQYLGDDLHNAGMPATAAAQFWSPEVPADSKYAVLAPWWDRVRHTGYAQAIRHTLRVLRYGLEYSGPSTRSGSRDALACALDARTRIGSSGVF